MDFVSFREIRFADPVTAIKLSCSHLFYGTAMGRLVFYNIKDNSETVPLEYLQELIRGISHSKDGEKLYISVGDIEGIVYDAKTLSPECTIQLIDQPDHEDHKLTCERSYTMLHENMNCILSIKLLNEKINTETGEAKPITIADFDTQIVDQKGEFEFDNNSVPFDFDGSKLLWMNYETKKQRIVYVYDLKNDDKIELMDLKNSDGLVYHMKLFKNKVVYVRNTKEVMVCDMDSADDKCLGKSSNQILAIHVYDERVTSYDREILARDGVRVSDYDEENKENHTEESTTDSFKIVTLDSKGKINFFINKNGFETKHMFDIRTATDFPEELKKKDFFSMGYPYIITAYHDLIAFSSDYGVFLLKVDTNILTAE
jgi:hypothetical protein